MWVPRIILTRFVNVYLTLGAGSHWAGIVFHAAHNVMVYSYWAALPDTDGTRFPFARFMHAESGVTVVILYAAAAFAIVRKWKRQDEQHAQHAQSGAAKAAAAASTKLRMRQLQMREAPMRARLDGIGQ
jgi:cytochrome b561